MKLFNKKPTNDDNRPLKIITNKFNKKVGYVYKEIDKSDVVDSKGKNKNNDEFVIYDSKEQTNQIGFIKGNELVINGNKYQLVDIEKNRKAVIENNKTIYTLYSFNDYELTQRIKKSKTIGTISKIVVCILLIILAITVLFPFYWMINTSLKTYSEYIRSKPTFWPHQVRWSNYLTAFNKANLGYLFINTVYVGVVSTIISLVITVLAAFAFARLEFPGRDGLFSAMLGTMMIPGEMFTITNYSTVAFVDKIFTNMYTKQIQKGNTTGGIWGRINRRKVTEDLTKITPLQNFLLNLNINSESIATKILGSGKVYYEAKSFSNTYAVLIIPFLVSIYYIYLLRQNFKQIPNELYLAAKVDGTSDIAYLWKVMLPLSAPTIVTITILKMMGAWNSYVWPRLVANNDGMKLITNGIRSASLTVDGGVDTDYPLQMAAIVIVTIPLFLVFLCFRKYIMKGVSKSGTKG